MGKVIQFKGKDAKRTWGAELVNKMQERIIDEARNNGKTYFEIFICDDSICEGVEMCLMIDHVTNNVFKDNSIKILIGYYDKDKIDSVRERIKEYIGTNPEDKLYCSIFDVDIMN